MWWGRGQDIMSAPAMLVKQQHLGECENVLNHQRCTPHRHPGKLILLDRTAVCTNKGFLVVGASGTHWDADVHGGADGTQSPVPQTHVAMTPPPPIHRASQKWTHSSRRPVQNADPSMHTGRPCRPRPRPQSSPVGYYPTNTFIKACSVLATCMLPQAQNNSTPIGANLGDFPVPMSFPRMLAPGCAGNMPGPYGSVSWSSPACLSVYRSQYMYVLVCVWM